MGMTRATPLGWHVISGERLLEVLRRAAAGEEPDILFAEMWANADHELHVNLYGEDPDE